MSRRAFPLWRRLLGSALCLLLGALITYEAHLIQPRDDALRHLSAGVLIVGIDPSNPPFADGRNGPPVGLDVDVIEAVGARLGIRVEIHGLGFDGLYDALKVGSVDALISALSVDPSRLGDVIYCGGYFEAGTVIVAQGGTYRTMPDLEGRKVAVEYGSAADETARLWQRRLHELDEIPFPTTTEALDGMRAGKADAALVDRVDALLYARDHAGLTIAPESVAPDPYVIAVRLSSPQVAQRINDAIEAMRKDGSLEAIIARWLG